MTDLKFHFDDGSEYLAHYGKKGMHWGVWDENTQEKYAANPDLIGEFAKLLNGGGGGSQKPVYKGKNPYDVHAYNQSYQDQKRMNPVEAGARNIATVAGHHAKNLSDQAGRSFDRFAKDSGLAEASRKARNAANEFGKNAESAARSAAYNANKLASQASKSLSSAGSRALESGARVVDDIFGTSFSKRNKVRDARKRRQTLEKQDRVRKAAEKRRHSDRMEAGYKRDKEKRQRAVNAYWTEKHKHTNEMNKLNAKDKAKRERAMTKYKQRKTAEEILERNAAEKKAKKNIAKLNQKRAEYRKYGSSYQQERREDRWDAYKDRKAGKLYKMETDALYGKRGKDEYAKYAKKRAANHRKFNKDKKKRAMKYAYNPKTGHYAWRSSRLSRNGTKSY